MLKEFAENFSKKYMVKVRAVLGPDAEDDKEVTLLNRSIAWTPSGITIESDPRHAELVLRELGLNEDSKGSTTTGSKVVDDEDTKMLDKMETTKYRSVVARLNYMCSDRPDIQYSDKELCRCMSSPTTTSWSRLKRLGRYLKDHPRLMIKFDHQYMDGTCRIDVFADTDYAGCGVTRKSTNGGCTLRGSHCLKAWASTQSVVALSSGEAEYYGLTKAGCVGIGMKSLYGDFMIDTTMEVHLHTDSTAAKGIASRRGLGKLRHIEVQYFWLHDHFARKTFTLHKVLGTENPADLMTKYLPELMIIKCLMTMSMEYMSGRSIVAPALV